MPIPPDAVVNSNQSVPATDSDRAAFGDFLRRARHASGLSLRQIAEQTKVPPRYLEALERGQIEVLPDGLYRRAILRAYATAVKLDATVAVERLSATFEPKQCEQECVLTPTVEPEQVPPLREPIAAAFIGAVVILGVVAASALAPRVESREPVTTPSPPVATPDLLALAAESRPVATSGSVAVESTALPSTPSALTNTLSVISSPPGARVTVDGVGWGITPVTVQYLSPGAKVVRVSKDGYQSVERQINLARGDGPTEVELDLLPRD